MSTTNQPTSVQRPPSPATSFAGRAACLAGVLMAVTILCRTTGFPPDSLGAPASFSFDTGTTSGPRASSLASIRDADREDVASHLEGQWVAQLASQARGDNDQSYLKRHQHLDDSYGTYLTTTDDYSYPNTNGVTYWVTLLDAPFATEAEAQRWCDDQGLTTNDCLADLLAR
jgi:hypothetical protein